MVTFENAASLDIEEIKKWNKLYPTIQINELAELVQKLAKEDAELAQEYDWDGKLNFSGTQRFIMMLFDENQENNPGFYHMTEAVQEKIRNLDIDSFREKK